MDFPEPVSEARRNCLHLPNDASLGAISPEAPNIHFKLRPWIGVGVATGPRTSVRHDSSPGIKGGEVKWRGS